MGFSCGLYLTPKVKGEVVEPKIRYAVQNYLDYPNWDWAKKTFANAYECAMHFYKDTFEEDLEDIPEEEFMQYVNALKPFYEEYIDEFDKHQISRNIEYWYSNGVQLYDTIKDVCGEFDYNINLSKLDIIRLIEEITESIDLDKLMPHPIGNAFYYGEDDSRVSMYCDGVELFIDNNTIKIYDENIAILSEDEADELRWKVSYISALSKCLNASDDFVIEFNGGW